MQIAVISEYNPFHMGHEYQLEVLRKSFPDAVITAVMGGIFSQRGEPYITTPYVRANAALLGGADLVLELPFPFSAAPARIFARAGVELAVTMGADMLAFGSECGNLDQLWKMLARLESPELQEELAAIDFSATGKTRAYSNAYKKLYGEEPATLPNDILAIEYLRAIKSGGYSIKPYTVKRVGSYKSSTNGFASATSIREAFYTNGLEKALESIPSRSRPPFEKAYAAGLFGADIEKLSSAVMLKLEEELSETAFSSGGLINRIKEEAKTSTKISELIKKSATKRYTDAEISRCILYALLGVCSGDLDTHVYYTKLLAANPAGRSILKDKCNIELVTKPSACDKLSKNARRQYEKSFLAERAFSLCLDGKYEHLKELPIIL